MTDNELREKIADIFDTLEEPTNQFWHRDSALSWADKVMALVSARENRMIADELTKWADDQQITFGRTLYLKAMRERIAQLTQRSHDDE